MNYYCLIAGLPDLHPDDTKSLTNLLDLKSELLELLSSEDKNLLKLLFSKFDNQNWLKYLDNKDAELSPMGNLNASDLGQLLAMMQELENPNDARLNSYIKIFYKTYDDENFLADGLSSEDYLSGLYYEYAINCKNEFLKRWFEFNLNINNILTASTCRKHGFDLRSFVLGNNEIAQIIRSSNARDLGLTGVFEQLDAVLRITEEADLLEREKKIDTLKWNWLEENTFFNYFGIEKVLAFVIKTEMLERWKPLTVETGTQIFRELLGSMKEGVKFEE